MIAPELAAFAACRWHEAVRTFMRQRIGIFAGTPRRTLRFNRQANEEFDPSPPANLQVPLLSESGCKDNAQEPRVLAVEVGVLAAAANWLHLFIVL